MQRILKIIDGPGLWAISAVIWLPTAVVELISGDVSGMKDSLQLAALSILIYYSERK